MLADDVLRRPRLARRRPLVVEHADGRSVADERVEEDRARVADDDVDVLEQRREVLRGRCSSPPGRRRPRDRPRPRTARATACRAGAGGRGAGTARRRGACHHPTRRSTKRPSYGALLGVFPATSTSGQRRIEPVATEERLVLLARPPAVEEVGLRPPGDAHALRLDAVVAAQVVLHDPVLDEVDVAVRRDDALADRVVPARDVRDDREPEAAGRSEERHRARRLDVREHEAGALAAHRLEQPARDVPPRAEEPALHRPLDARPARERAVAIGVEHPVRVPRLHPLGVEAVPAVQADRERVVAEPAVEPGVDAARGRGRHARAGAVSSSPSSAGTAHALRPLRRLRPRGTR